MEIIPMNNMNLPPEIEFHEDIRLLIYRPRGLLNEAAINKVLSALEDLETKLQEPFNRFSDTLAADEVELNFKYVIQFSLHRRLAYAGHPPVKSAILAADSTMLSLRQATRLTDSRFSDQSPCVPGSQGSRPMARGAGRTSDLTGKRFQLINRNTKRNSL
jgi:hypothetical protein